MLVVLRRGTTEDAEKISFIMESKIYALFVVTSFVREHITIRFDVLKLNSLNCFYL